MTSIHGLPQESICKIFYELTLPDQKNLSETDKKLNMIVKIATTCCIRLMEKQFNVKFDESEKNARFIALENFVEEFQRFKLYKGLACMRRLGKTVD
jgi:hypothetical protein